MKTWLIKAGGELFSLPSTRKKIFSDIKKQARSHGVILVHGGGPQIEAALKKAGIRVRFIQGRRFTSTQAVALVENVLSGTINKAITAELVKRGVRAVGLSGRDGGLMVGQAVAQLGRAGKPAKVQPRLIQTLLKNKFVPVVSSVASDKKGQPLNINADDAASALATALKVDHLVFLTKTSGVLDKQGKRIPVLKTKQIPSLIRTGVIQGGMIPKVQSAWQAIQKGVGEVDILNGYKGLNLKSGTRIIA